MTRQQRQPNCLQHIRVSIVTFLSTHIQLTLCCSDETASDEVTGDKQSLLFTTNTARIWYLMEIIQQLTLVYFCMLENDKTEQQRAAFPFTFSADNKSLSAFIFEFGLC